MVILGFVNYFLNNQEIDKSKNQYILLKKSYLKLAETQVILSKIDDLILLNKGIKVILIKI